MPKVEFTANLQRHVALPPTEAQGRTVREVLDRVFSTNERARSYVLDEQGALRPHMVIFVNGEPITDRLSLSDAVSDSDEIFILQALSGG
jgi:molybdopterin converting factor small subunit